MDESPNSVPSDVVDTCAFLHLRNLPVADETFGTPNKIDILIGAPLFAHLLLPHNIVHASEVTLVPPALRTV